jgi:hypothetical protein
VSGISEGAEFAKRNRVPQMKRPAGGINPPVQTDCFTGFKLLLGKCSGKNVFDAAGEKVISAHGVLV